MSSILDDDALPQRIREAVWYQSWYTEKGIPAEQRTALTYIRNENYTELFNIVFPEEDRRGLIHEVTQSIFTWLNTDAIYPELQIQVAPIMNQVSQNTLGIANWALDVMLLPPASRKQIATLEAKEYGTDPMKLLSCMPPAQYRGAVADTLSGMILGMLNETKVPASVNVTKIIQGKMGKAKIKVAKNKVNQMRIILRYIWLLPVLLLIIGIAFAVRSLNGLIKWTAWPLFITGLIGLVIALPMSNPFELLQSQLQPPPVGIPAPGIPLILALLTKLLIRIGNPLIWKMLTLLVLGSVGLIYFYRRVISNFFLSVARILKKWFEVREKKKNR
jgi:hypothetical protein